MAKIASREKNKQVEDGELFVVVNKVSGRRPYVGPGTNLEDATRVAAGMAIESIAVPADQVEGRVWVNPEVDADDAEVLVETRSSE